MLEGSVAELGISLGEAIAPGTGSVLDLSTSFFKLLGKLLDIGAGGL